MVLTGLRIGAAVLATRMKAVVHLVVIRTVDVCVLEGGVEADVAEEVAEVVEIHAVLEQVGGEGVAEDARVDGIRDACTLGVLAHHRPETDAAHAGAVASREEARILRGGQPWRP